MSQSEKFRLNGHQNDPEAIDGVVGELIKKKFFNNIMRDLSQVTPEEVIREFINTLKKLKTPYSYPDIARVLNIPIGKVSQLITAFVTDGILERDVLPEG